MFSCISDRFCISLFENKERQKKIRKNSIKRLTQPLATVVSTSTTIELKSKVKQKKIEKKISIVLFPVTFGDMLSAVFSLVLIVSEN